MTLTSSRLASFPFRTIPGQPRRPVVGWFVSAAGWLLALGITGVWLILLGIAMDRYGEVLGLVFFVILAPAVIVIFPRSVQLMARGRRMRALRAGELLDRDQRSPLLLLRSFQDDDLIDPSFQATNQTVPVRYELPLARALRALGPVIAIGRPGEPEPELGAARLYVADADWQVAVAHMMSHAAAVVVVVGRSTGLWWEIDTAVKQVPPERLLLFFPYPAPGRIRGSFWYTAFLQNPFWGKIIRRRLLREMETERWERYRIFREHFGNLFKFPLPDGLGNSRFVHFDSDGRPLLLLPQQPSLLHRMLTLNFRPSSDIPFTNELRPFVAKLERFQVRTTGGQQRTA